MHDYFCFCPICADKCRFDVVELGLPLLDYPVPDDPFRGVLTDREWFGWIYAVLTGKDLIVPDAAYVQLAPSCDGIRVFHWEWDALGLLPEDFRFALENPVWEGPIGIDRVWEGSPALPDSPLSVCERQSLGLMPQNGQACDGCPLCPDNAGYAETVPVREDLGAYEGVYPGMDIVSAAAYFDTIDGNPPAPRRSPEDDGYWEELGY